MWRSAVLRFGMLGGIAAAACGGTPKTTQGGGAGAIGNQAAAADGDSRDMTAAYWCAINSGGYGYPAMPCVVKRVNGRFMLAKLAGSQRFRGVVTPRANGDAGFAFDGEFYCPYGDCTKPMRGEFVPARDGTLVGAFDGGSLVVTMTRSNDTSEFGGVGYGGDGYGGFGYGGTQLVR